MLALGIVHGSQMRAILGISYSADITHQYLAQTIDHILQRCKNNTVFFFGFELYNY